MEMKVEKSRKWFVFNSANAEQNKQRGEPQHLRVSELVKCCIFPSHPRSPLPPKVSIPLLRYAEISRIDIRLLRVKITSLQRSRARKNWKIQKYKGGTRNRRGSSNFECGSFRYLPHFLCSRGWNSRASLSGHGKTEEEIQLYLYEMAV